MSETRDEILRKVYLGQICASALEERQRHMSFGNTNLAPHDVQNLIQWTNRTEQ